MRHPTPQTLAEAPPGTAFLDLRWNEFYDRHTIDTFRPRFGNLPSVVSEIRDVGGRLGERADWAYHVDHLREELKSMLSVVREYKWLTTAELWQVDRLASSTGPDAAKIAATICGCGFKDSFESRMIAELRKLPAVLPREKKRAEAVLNQLATIALHRKLGDVKLEGSLKLAPADWVEGLIQRLAGTTIEFEVFVLVRSRGAGLEPGDLNTLLNNSGFETVPPTQLDQLGLPALPNGGVLIIERVSAPASDDMTSWTANSPGISGERTCGG